jgi:hypothetical protein
MANMDNMDNIMEYPGYLSLPVTVLYIDNIDTVCDTLYDMLKDKLIENKIEISNEKLSNIMCVLLIDFVSVILDNMSEYERSFITRTTLKDIDYESILHDYDLLSNNTDIIKILWLLLTSDDIYDYIDSLDNHDTKIYLQLGAIYIDIISKYNNDMNNNDYFDDITSICDITYDEQYLYTSSHISIKDILTKILFNMYGLEYQKKSYNYMYVP